MRTIAIANQKGGAGKTTSAVNLAAALGELEKRVLLLDLDPQASATRWLGVEDGGRGLRDALIEGGSLADLIVSTSAPGVHLVPSSAWLVGVEKALAGEVGAERILRKRLQTVPARRFDLLLIDCPPSLGILSLNALCASGDLIAPVEASAMALAGVADLVRTLEHVQERLDAHVTLLGVLVCRLKVQTNIGREVLEALRARFGDRVFETAIRETVRLTEAPSHKQPITTYDPNGAGAEDYRAAARELLRRIGG